jgi:hypothetical protein
MFFHFFCEHGEKKSWRGGRICVFLRKQGVQDMATLKALLDTLNHVGQQQAMDPRTARQLKTCSLCGANSSDLQAVLDREAKQQNIHSGQQRLLEVYARDCDGLTRRLAAAHEAIEDKDRLLAAMQRQREEDVALLKRAMHELERARDLMPKT